MTEPRYSPCTALLKPTDEFWCLACRKAQEVEAKKQALFKALGKANEKVMR